MLDATNLLPTNRDPARRAVGALPSDVFRGLGCRPGTVELSAPGGEGAVFEGFDQPVGPGDGVFRRGGALAVDASLPDVTLGRQSVDRNGAVDPPSEPAAKPNRSRPEQPDERIRGPEGAGWHSPASDPDREGPAIDRDRAIRHRPDWAALAPSTSRDHRKMIPASPHTPQTRTLRVVEEFLPRTLWTGTFRASGMASDQFGGPSLRWTVMARLRPQARPKRLVVRC